MTIETAIALAVIIAVVFIATKGLIELIQAAIAEDHRQ